MNDTSGNGLLTLVQDILSGIDRQAIQSRLEAAGFYSSPQLAAHIESLAEKICAGEAACSILASILPPFLASPHPESACRNLLRYLENRADPLSFLRTLQQGRPVLEILATTFGSSQYMADILIRNPGTLYWLIERQVWDREESAEDYEREIKADVAIFSTFRGKIDALKRFHRRMLLKIGVQDLLGQRTLDATIRRLSNLADAIVITGLEAVWEEMLEKASPPAFAAGTDRANTACEFPVASGFAVIAMGKLGGGELNYSSDIDLIFLCENVEDTALAFYRILAERLTALLSEATEEGYLYRVDLRLRPDGETGPIVNTAESMRVYYETRGKPWEFQAYLKSRVIAGDRELGELYLRRIEGLMFNPSLPYSPVETIALQRSRIQVSISVRDRAFNIKLMEGGIRDIEFIVQTIQLLHGMRHPDLRTPATLEAIGRIKEKNLLKRYEADALCEAYRFFRLVEHRLQMMHQIKAHSVPETDEEIDTLSRRVSSSDHGPLTKESFLETLTKHLNKVRVLAESFFAGTTPPETSLLLMLSDSDPRVRSILERYGLSDTTQALGVIHSMAYGAFPRLLDRRTRLAFEKLLPQLLEAVSQVGDPGLTLSAIANIASSHRSEAAFYGFLQDQPALCSLLVLLANLSPVLANNLCKHPEMFDRLLLDGGAVLAESLDPFAAIRDNPVRAANLEALSGTISSAVRARNAFELAAVIESLKNGTFPDSIQAHITAFARAAIKTVFELMIGDEGAALFALGSYGVGEPRLRSDIDLLIAVDFTRRPDAREDLIKAAQRLNGLISDAGLFKLDFRLRGEGANAPLVQGVAFYEEYFTGRIAPWEKIAFAKCRFWGGDQALAGDFFSRLSDVLTKPLTAGEAGALLDTRRKIEAIVPSAQTHYDTKRSKGGRYDIEYLCGAAITIAGCADGYPFSIGTIERLEKIRGAGIISAEDLDACRDALRLYGTVEYCMELKGFTLPHSAARRREIERYLERTFAALDIPLPRGIEQSLADCKRRVRECFDAVFKYLRRTE